MRLLKNASTYKYRDDFYLVDEFTSLHFTAAGVLLAMRHTRILLMNQPIMF
jgi:hypothetical protein